MGGEPGLLVIQGGAVGVWGEAVALAVLHPSELVVQLLLHPPLHLVLLLFSLAPGPSLQVQRSLNDTQGRTLHQHLTLLRQVDLHHW